MNKIMAMAALAFASVPTQVAAHNGHASGTSAKADTMTTAARAFMATLSETQRQAATRPFDDDAARTNWNYLPSNWVTRDGIALTELNDEQRAAVHKIFSAALSSQGYGKATQIMWLDDILRDIVQARIAAAKAQGQSTAEHERALAIRDSQQYWLSVFGEPGSARWGWMISGHHLAANFTVVDGEVAFTPLFLGASPQSIVAGRYAGWQTLHAEIDRAFALLGSLTAAQQAQAFQAAKIPDAMFADKGHRSDLTQYAGLRASALNAAQRKMLMALVAEYVGNAQDKAAERQMAAINRDGPAALHIAWWGSTSDPKQRFMYRIHGPSILIEMVREADADGGPTNHVHSIVRDPRNDYGKDWLKRHYQEQHQPSAPMR